MASPQAGLPDELAGHQVLRGVPSPILPNGPGYPRIVQAWLWLKKRRGSSTAAHLEPLVGPHSVLVLDGPEHLRQRKLILPAFHGDRMRAWKPPSATSRGRRSLAGRWASRRDRRPHDPRRSDRVPQHLPRPAARGPLPGPGRVPSGSVRRPDAPGFRLVSFRWRHPAVPGCQLRHVRDADRRSRGAEGRDVRPSRWRALRRDRPESAPGSAIKDDARDQ